MQKLQICAERVWRLALDLAIQAGRIIKGGRNGKGIAVVAEEVRSMSLRLYDDIDKMQTTEGFDICNMKPRINELRLIALNGSFETLRLSSFNDYDSDTIAIAVILEELEHVLAELEILLGFAKENEPVIIPEITARNKALTGYVYLLKYTIGGVSFVENLQFINEIYRFDNNEITEETTQITIRDYNLPLRNFYKEMGFKLPDSPNKYILSLNANLDKDDSSPICVIIDEPPYGALFKSRIGSSTAVRGNAHPIRDCWDAEPEQMLFLDIN